MIPQTNAKLISVTRPSETGAYTEDYDRPAISPPGGPLWQGYLDAYIQRKLVSNFGQGGELNRVLEVTLIISTDIPVVLQPGDTVVYQAGNPDSFVTLAGRIQNITDPAYLPSLADYYQCALEEVNLP